MPNISWCTSSVRSSALPRIHPSHCFVPPPHHHHHFLRDQRLCRRETWSPYIAMPRSKTISIYILFHSTLLSLSFFFNFVFVSSSTLLLFSSLKTPITRDCFFRSQTAVWPRGSGVLRYTPHPPPRPPTQTCTTKLCFLCSDLQSECKTDPTLFSLSVFLFCFLPPPSHIAGSTSKVTWREFQSGPADVDVNVLQIWPVHPHLQPLDLPPSHLCLLSSSPSILCSLFLPSLPVRLSQSHSPFQCPYLGKGEPERWSLCIK